MIRVPPLSQSILVDIFEEVGQQAIVHSSPCQPQTDEQKEEVKFKYNPWKHVAEHQAQ